MKENKLNDKKIINTLTKKGYIEIYPICDECALYIIGLVFDHFTSANFNMLQIEDELYVLKINV